MSAWFKSLRGVHALTIKLFAKQIGMRLIGEHEHLDLYLHGFFVTDDGKWTVVQQGMNGDKKQAPRYHWHSENLKSFVDEPHSPIDGPAQGEIVNLTNKRPEASRARQLDLLDDLGPDRIGSELAALTGEGPAQAQLPHLIMPAHHDVRSSDVFTRRLHGTLAAAAERGPCQAAVLPAETA